MYIFETWIPSMKFKKEVKKYLASQIELHGIFYEVEIFCRNMNFNFDLTEDDMEKNNNKWRKAFSSFLDDCINEAVYTIEKLSKNGEIECWREITLPENEKPDPNRHPGIYWSWDKHSAEAHWGDGSLNKWLYHAKIPLNCIDWKSTIIANANPSFTEEKEITVYSNSVFPFTFSKNKYPQFQTKYHS